MAMTDILFCSSSVRISPKGGGRAPNAAFFKTERYGGLPALYSLQSAGGATQGSRGLAKSARPWLPLCSIS